MAGDADDGGFGVDRHAPGAGHHGRERAGGPFDRIDALRARRTGNGDGGPVARDALHDHLRIGRLRIEFLGDLGPQLFGRGTGGANAPGIGDEDEAFAIDLQFLQLRQALARIAQKRIVLDVFIDRDGQPVAGGDDIRSQPPGGKEASRKAQRGRDGGRPGDTTVHRDDEGIAFAQDGACEDFLLVRAAARQAASRDRAHKHNQGHGPGPVRYRHFHCSGSLMEFASSFDVRLQQLWGF